MAEDIEPCHRQVGARIEQIRTTLGLTQEELAVRVGMERTSVTNIERGRQRLLLNTVEKFARALGTTPKNLMRGIWL